MFIESPNHEAMLDRLLELEKKLIEAQEEYDQFFFYAKHQCQCPKNLRFDFHGMTVCKICKKVHDAW